MPMTLFFRPPFVVALAILFVACGLLGGSANDLDVGAIRAMAELRTAWPSAIPWIIALTSLGAAPVTLSLTAISSLAMLRRAPAAALLLALTVLVERSSVDLLKEWIGRPRPSFGVLGLPHSLAYPSGHAANSMTAFLAIALIAAPPAYRRPAVAAALILSFAVGLSRIYLCVHWPSDVIGGWAFGLLAVAIALAIGRRSGALKEQHQIVGRHRLALDEDEPA
jgi:undecaprenyl-diphosphatase